MKQFKFNERQRFSIRKFSIGAASVLLGSVFFAVSSVEDVQAAEQSQNVVSANENKQTPEPLISSNSSTTGVSTKEANTSVSDANVENKPEGDVVGSSKETQESVPVVSTISDSNERKLALSKLIEEIDGKFTNGKYASKTEDSVNKLKAALEEARSVLSNATTESELTQAHSKLVTATTQLKTKPTEKKEEPGVDTTNGKATVGIKATNTEKAADTNSIANSGSRDERHGKALDRSNPFRTDADPANTDPSANQTYTLPGDSASVTELANSLKGLDSSISNETKLASIDEVGRLKNVQAGEVKEIDEFGGWSAVSADGKKGKFAIARKTEAGVYPIETVNVTRTGYTYTAHVEENSFDRSHEYALFLSKVRTNATKSEETFDGQPFKDIGEGRQIAKGLKGFNGIEKTYKAYSSSTGTGVNISFKTGFTGDIDGFKAGYKVEVIAKFEDGHTQSIYNQSFRPDQSINDAYKKVVSVDANDRSKFTVGRPPEPTISALNQKLAEYKNSQGNRTGSFTSKNIELPKGAVEYTVRISASDNSRLGMGYQTTWAQYALPVSGLGFTITQDTNRVARTLLERVYNKLLDTRDADKRGKTPESQKAYQDQLDAIKALLDGELKTTDEYKRLVQPTLAALEALKVDKSALTTSKGELDQLVDDDPTPGKTPETVSEYNIAKSAAEEEARKAKLVIDDEHATVDQVAQAVADVRAKRAELRAARALLVVAATEAQKTKLQNDSNALTEADKTGKTPKSIAEYDAKYETLKTALTAAKAQAKAVLDKAENAGKVEATDAQIEVDKIKAELEKAAALLKEKGNTTELEKAKNDLKTLTQETNVTAGKTQATADKYNAAKTAAEEAVTAAEAVISDINSTTEDVANALAEIKVKKAALEAAKAALVDKATDAQKTKLEESAAKLVKADTAGKTQDSINAYETTYTNLTAELEAAKAKATAIKTAGDNASEYAVLKAQEAVDAVLAKLESAKATLVDKATDDQVAELRKAEAALTPAEESTLAGTKTPASIAEYKKAVDAIQSQLTEAKAKAADLVTKAEQNNAKKVDAAEAIAKVDALKVELTKANALLKDKANTSDLATAKDELKELAKVENVTDGKTTSTATAYTAAKQEADAAVAKAEGLIANPNATPEEVAEALTEVKAKKAELEKAKAALVDKATDAQKTKLEESAAKLVKADTAGKTQDSINEYETTYTNLTAELEAAKAKATAIKTAGDNASEYAVLKAQEAVDAVLAKLESAKATLVDKATDDQVAELRKAEAALTPAEESTLAGTKTPASIAAYKDAVNAIQTQLTEAKAKAADLVTKAGQDNAKKVDAAEAIAKVDALKVELAKANALLKDKANTSDLATAKDELKELAKVENVTDGKTTSTATAYTAAKQEADAAVAKAEGLIANPNATPEEVAEALTEVKAKKAELEKAKAALVDKATDAQKTKLEESAAKLVKADTAGKTQESINAYETTYNDLTRELEDAKAKVAAIKTAGDNASRLEALAAQEAVDAVLAKLEAAKATLVDKATEEQVAELRKAEAALTPAEESTLAGTKTPASIAAYKDAVAAIQTQLTEAKAKATDLVTKAGQNNATKAEAAAAIAKVEELKVELAKANALLKDKANTGDLAAAKEELKALAGEANVTDGKTTSTTEAYDAAKQAADAAVAAAENIINNADSTPEQVAEALTNVKAKKAELEKAKAALVDKATEAQKTKLEADAAKLVKADTAGKTQDSINAYETTYTNLTAELEATKAKATAVKAAGDNASEYAALKAQEAVDAVQAKLEAAKATLVDKATEEQVAELRKAEAALTPAEESSLAGTKTPASIAEYKKAVDAIQAQLTQAKTTASDLVTKAGQNNATKAEAAAAIAKVEELKVELAKANALLKDKANTGDLAAAKEELKALAGVENVTDGKTTSTKEAYDAAKRDADAAVTAAEGIINNADSSPEQVAEALTNVKVKKAELEKAKAALVDKITQDQKDDLANAEENLKLADTTGKTKESIKAYNDEVAKLSDELAVAKQTAKDLIAKGDNAGELEAYKVQAKINKLKSKLAEAAKLLKDIDKSAAKKEVEDAAKKATDAIMANNDLTSEQKEAAKVKVAEEANKAIAAIERATTEDDVIAEKNAGKFAIEKEAAKAEIEAAKAAKEKAINANDKLSDDEKRAGNEAIAKAADAAEKAIDAATDQATVEGAKTTGIKAVTAVNPVGKEKALDAIQKATEDKLAEIDKNDKLSAKEKAEAKAKVAKAAIDAVNAIIAATDQTAVDSAQTTGTTAVATVNPVGKEKALAEIDKALAAKEKAIEANDKLSDAEKQAAKEAAKKAADDAKKAINDAQNQEAVDNAKNAGISAVEAVNPVGKDKAKAEIEATKAAKEKAIDSNPDLTDAQKAEAKAKIAEAAKKAIDAIDKAKTTEEVASAKESGKLAIEKEAEKAEIEAAKAAKEKAIDARTDLTDDEKAKAKAKVAEEAKKAIEAIGNAKTHNDASAKTETGKDDIKKINPIGGKETAKKAIDEALAAKEKAIDARTDLLPEEKEAAKKAAREEAEAAKNAIDKATTSDDIKKVLDNGLDKIAKVNPLGAKEEAKKSIEERLADKEKEIDARTDLTPEEKAKAKALAREEAKAAKDAIDKATSIEGIEKALRPFLYQIDQDALVFDRPALDTATALQASVTGVVTVERGKAISQADIIAKLNLPETVTVMNIELPDTNTLGDKFAKVTLRLAGGKEVTVKVPVRVVASQNGDSKPETVLPDYGRNNGATNTDARVDKAKLEGAIHQLDELIIKESAKLDAETAKEANDLLADAKKVFANADASQAEVDAMVKRIEDFIAKVAPSTDHATPANDQSAQTPAVAPATTQAAANASQEVAANARKAAKELPNTGTADSTVAMVSAAASALLGLGLAGRRRKEDEEA